MNEVEYPDPICNGDILQEEGLWYLVRVPEYDLWQSWVVHGCRKRPDGCRTRPDSGSGIHHKLGYFVRIDHDNPTCMGCGVAAPSKFKTLWTLHNWDALQGYLQRNPK